MYYDERHDHLDFKYKDESQEINNLENKEYNKYEKNEISNYENNFTTNDMKIGIQMLNSTSKT